ncbi:MAG: hypothetical protein ACJAY8_000666 [Sphingobacteriales bacterium]|jgi:hypothetical protein
MSFITLTLIFLSNFVGQPTIWEDLFQDHFKPSCEKLEYWEDNFKEADLYPEMKAWITISQAVCPWNPVSKYAFFNTGKDQLEGLIKAEPNRFLARFLRLTVQEHAPVFLGYRDNIEPDREFVMSNVAEFENEPYYSFVVDYIQRHPKEVK